MDELDFNDREHISRFNRSGYNSSMKPEQKRVRKQHKFREIEQRLEEKRLRRELSDLYHY